MDRRRVESVVVMVVLLVVVMVLVLLFVEVVANVAEPNADDESETLIMLSRCAAH